MKLGGKYYELFSTQAKHYIENISSENDDIPRKPDMTEKHGFDGHNMPPKPEFGKGEKPPFERR